MPIAASRAVPLIQRVVPVVLAAVAGVSPAGADTVINGGNLTTQTWTLSNSPYIVQGDVTVVVAETLTIEAGVSLLFASADSQGAGVDSGRVEFTVNGTLRVQSTAANPVTFRAQTGSGTNIWYGIVLSAMTADATFGPIDVRNAVRGLSSAFPGTVNLEQATFIANGTAMAISAGNAVLSRVTASGGGNGLLFTGTAHATIDNAVIAANTGYGISVNTSAATVTSIEHATIHGNGTYGIAAAGSHSGAQRRVKNSVVSGNQYGMHRSVTDTAAFEVTYTDVWNNSAADYTNVSPGVGTLSEDPDYVAAPADLHLRETSPVIDAGDYFFLSVDRDGTVRPRDGDHDGASQSDMGAYEFVPIDLIFADGFEATS
jgi:parallel beta helix pectate lyase-like protein